jgi:hypothetical protein
MTLTDYFPRKEDLVFDRAELTGAKAAGCVGHNAGVAMHKDQLALDAGTVRRLAEYVGDRLCQYEHPAIVCGRERRRAPSRDRTPDL